MEDTSEEDIGLGRDKRVPFETYWLSFNVLFIQ